MKRKHLVLAGTVLLLAGGTWSCKAMARAAAKYWTKKQIKEFVNNCETKSAKLVGEEKAAKFCDCAVDVVAEKYKIYEDAKKISVRDILQIANDCK